MLVPRSFKYSSSPPSRDSLDIRSDGRRMSEKVVVTKTSPRPTTRRTPSPAQVPSNTTAAATDKPVRVPTPPIPVPVPSTRTQSIRPRTMPTVIGRGTNGSPRKSPSHDQNALPPAVAALLAVTAIPRPKPSQFRRRQRLRHQISIDELMNEWRTDEALNASLSSSPALSALLELSTEDDNNDENHDEDHDEQEKESLTEESFWQSRSVSDESIPSLEADDKSVFSVGGPSTPESLRSRKSSNNLRREKTRSLPASENCVFDHPLIPGRPGDDDPDDALIISPATSRTSTPKPKSSFKSNLTSSLQALKNAALSFTTSTSPPHRSAPPRFSDDTLWSHPFLFPRFSPEVRPPISGTPSQAQRRYFNPPLNFEEQEAPYQRALHGPYLAEHRNDAPAIQMQQYTRGRRKALSRRGSAAGGPSPNSEAGRALLAQSSSSEVRQREPRENSDFLRRVVLEMNMRRAGKLETGPGRARIWLPPRQPSPVARQNGRVPRRWVGVGVN